MPTLSFGDMRRVWILAGPGVERITDRDGHGVAIGREAGRKLLKVRLGAPDRRPIAIMQVKDAQTLNSWKDTSFLYSAGVGIAEVLPFTYSNLPGVRRPAASAPE